MENKNVAVLSPVEIVEPSLRVQNHYLLLEMTNAYELYTHMKNGDSPNSSK